MAKIFVGMSGGVDSSAAAYLLKAAGHAVTGVTFTALNEQGFKKCCSLEEINAAREVCKALGIPHKIIDVKDVFFARIIHPFIESYKKGQTPNPCVFCNRFIKFGATLEYSLSMGAEYFATGHYANIVRDGVDYYIEKGVDAKKDQSYFLSMVEREKLPYMTLPLGGYTKPEVRAIVEKSGLPISHSKAESQDVCFIENDYRDFLRKWEVPESPGDFLYQGRIVGRHRGIPFYSYGQRRGLNIAVGERVFVQAIDASTNSINLGEKPLSREFSVDGINSFIEPFASREYEVQVRYQSEIFRASIETDGQSARVLLDRPGEIISPGQIAVFYQGNRVLAAGVIRTVKLFQNN